MSYDNPIRLAEKDRQTTGGYFVLGDRNNGYSATPIMIMIAYNRD